MLALLLLGTGCRSGSEPVPEPPREADTDVLVAPDATADTAVPPDPSLLPAGHNVCGAPTSGAWYLDVTDCAGLSGALHVLRQPDPTEWYVTGQSFADFDGDGWLDVFVTSQASDNHLYLGRSDGRFVERTDAALRTLSAGAVTSADVDDDGWVDLMVTGIEQDWLFLNDQGTFPHPEPGGPASRAMGHGVALADLLGDGRLDAYLANYFCAECTPGATPRESAQDLFFLNTTSGWIDRTETLFGMGVETQGMGFAATWADFDSDGDLDLYVVNDKGGIGSPDPDWLLNRNAFWRNDGPGCDLHCFTEISLTNGTDLRIDSMGVAVGDYDGDLDLDLAVSDSFHPYLLQNQGDGTFLDVTDAAGLGHVVGVGWGLTWLDADNDGDLDLFNAQTNSDSLWENDGAGGFVQRNVEAGLADGRRSYGVAAADYDRDGRVDLLVGDSSWAYRLMRNVRDSSNHWLGLRLVGSGAGGSSAIGTRVYVTDDAGVVQLRDVRAGSSLGSGEDLGLHFGFGERVPVEVRVVWPDGTEHVTTPVPDRWSVLVR